MAFHIKPAQPINDRLLIAIAGPQASGKTTSALRIATGITQVTGGKICFIDTENKRALKYAKAFNFNHLELDPPFSPDRYDEAVKFAENQGYGEGDVIIIDSMSHEHEGPGGVLEIHDQYLASKNYNPKFNMLGWNVAKKGRKRFISYRLQRTPCHIILCFRAKQDLKEQQVNGQTKYVNEGLAPIGADEYFYEMDISLILPLGSMGKPDWTEKNARINEFGQKKPLTELLHNTQQISEETGKKIAEISMIAPPVELTPEQKTRKLAGDIVRQISTCSDSGDLETVMVDREHDLEEIKKMSESTYQYVKDAYDKRRVELGG